MTISADLQRRMVREATRFALTRRPVLVGLVVLAAVLVLDLLYLVLAAAGGRPASGSFVFIALFAALFPVVLIVSTARGIRRSLAVAMPVGSEVEVAAAEDGISSRTARGTATSAWAAYRTVHVGRDVVLLPLAGSRIFSVVPRAALSDEDLAVVRGRLASR